LDPEFAVPYAIFIVVGVGGGLLAGILILWWIGLIIFGASAVVSWILHVIMSA